MHKPHMFNEQSAPPVMEDDRISVLFLLGMLASLSPNTC